MLVLVSAHVLTTCSHFTYKCIIAVLLGLLYKPEFHMNLHTGAILRIILLAGIPKTV